MTQIHSYLTFNGNCRQAMTFYRDCFGGELIFQTIGDSPLSQKMPRRMKNFIVHSVLSKDALLLMASDMVGDEGLVRGSNVSLSLNCTSEQEIKNYYAKLSAGGTANRLPEENAWGSLFGDLTDKFGNHWILHYQKSE